MICGRLRIFLIKLMLTMKNAPSGHNALAFVCISSFLANTANLWGAFNGPTPHASEASRLRTRSRARVNSWVSCLMSISSENGSVSPDIDAGP